MHLKRLYPELRVECTDYATESIVRLKSVFVNLDDGYTFDMLDGNYSELNQDSILIMYRVSTEFNREQWFNIFRKMFESRIERIIYVPTGLDTIKEMIREKLLHLYNKVLQKKDVFCGWLYSEDEFIKMFNGKDNKALYVIESRFEYEKTAIFFFKKKSRVGMI